MVLRTFGWSFAVTAAGLAFAAWQWGWEAFGVVLILSILEISLSFDNAVVNAGILKKMNAFWQRIFLTLGILIAVFGMRLVFPVVIVAISAKVGPIEAVQLALDEPGRYEDLVTDAHPAIAAFGGMFLLMIFLEFILEDREIKWLAWLERPLAKLGAFAITNHIFWMALGLAIGAMYVRSLTVYLVRQGTLDDYVYLEHGAHYAIGALATILLITIQHQISEIITGLIGVVLIAASFLASVRRNKTLAVPEGRSRTPVSA
ncbi:DUF475 domain-containing protein [Streptomyces tirandamycinicus]|uniref:DUF475 domain-containing protein n=1 Tax=Streptomyces tirandamycinicus TaxID=2174846 RepID=UPI00226DBF8E|nr:DUF475 domain-containing protein [Streptomyces tirandamycinicus]MCY0982096.1 DUF475 domain-containing protein [Streptomyces tirandamycinicus]